MARLTYKKLAEIVSEKLRSVDINHESLEAFNSRNTSDDIEAGACLITFRIKKAQSYTTMIGFQSNTEIEQIINTGSYSVQIFPTNQFTITDAEIRFINIP